NHTQIVPPLEKAENFPGFITLTHKVLLALQATSATVTYAQTLMESNGGFPLLVVPCVFTHQPPIRGFS
ncbi:hypothetical protein JOQ06_001237, partial [Pogonophryne albipinna]